MTTSNSGVIRQPLLSTDAHVMGASEATYVDPIMASRLEAARQGGYEQGFADGARAAEAGARRSAETALSRLRIGVEEAQLRLAAANAELVPALVDVAVEIARDIVDRVPDQVREAVVTRLTGAIEEMDADAMVVVVSPGDLAEVSAAIGEVTGLTVRSDDRLATGEARIESQWCRADLTLATAWRIVEAAARG